VSFTVGCRLRFSLASPNHVYTRDLVSRYRSVPTRIRLQARIKFRRCLPRRRIGSDHQRPDGSLSECRNLGSQPNRQGLRKSEADGHGFIAAAWIRVEATHRLLGTLAILAIIVRMIQSHYEILRMSMARPNVFEVLWRCPCCYSIIRCIHRRSESSTTPSYIRHIMLVHKISLPYFSTFLGCIHDQRCSTS
jgi:hypothetical protein